MPVETQALDSGSRLGRFTILGRIGRDSTGVLYRAREVEKNRLVALRVLDEPTEDPEFLERIRQSSRVRHKNIQHLCSMGKFGERHFVAMEYSPGQSLRKRLEKGEPMDPRQSLKILRRVTRALRVAANAGLVHGHLRPSAILLSESGAVKVTGIGLPQDAGRDPGCYDGVRGLLPFYSPPEDLHGADPADQRRTVFTLGAILYHMVAGRAPLCGDRLQDALARHAQHGIEPLERVRPGTPAIVCELVDRALQTPPLRFQTLAELAQAIRAALRHLEGGEIEPSDPEIDE